MTDLETRLTDGLTGTAERAPHPVDLAAGARERLRLRRRTTAAAVAAALAVAAIPVGLTLVGGPGDRSTVSDAPDGWRTETWRDLSVSVPPEWENLGGQDWCLDRDDRDESRPQVSRPTRGGSVTCTPQFGYGAHFSAPSTGELPPGTEGAVQQYHGDQRYPDGAWIAYLSTRHAAVWIVTDDAVTTRRVLDTLDPVAEVDANGCASQAWRWRPSDTERVSVCRYATDGWLEQSELLSPEDSRAAGSALQSAPPARGVSPRCSASYPARPVVTMSAAGFSARLFSGRGCGIASVFSDGSGTGAMVTEDVLYWALSPGWSGSLPDAAPERLRVQ